LRAARNGFISSILYQSAVIPASRAILVKRAMSSRTCRANCSAELLQ